jgi:hypothetical protein
MGPSGTGLRAAGARSDRPKNHDMVSRFPRRPRGSLVRVPLALDGAGREQGSGLLRGYLEALAADKDPSANLHESAVRYAYPHRSPLLLDVQRRTTFGRVRHRGQLGAHPGRQVVRKWNPFPFRTGGHEGVSDASDVPSQVTNALATFKHSQTGQVLSSFTWDERVPGAKSV